MSVESSKQKYSIRMNQAGLDLEGNKLAKTWRHDQKRHVQALKTITESISAGIEWDKKQLAQDKRLPYYSQRATIISCENTTVSTSLCKGLAANCGP